MSESFHEPIWLEKSFIILAHTFLIKEHGGLQGIRDRGALDSALARPVGRYSYSNPDFYDLATSYAYGITKNHPFVDGNKRVALAAAYTFLENNGFQFTFPLSHSEGVMLMNQLTTGEIDEMAFSKMLRTSSKR